MQKVKVGLVGCGAIAPAYLRNLQSHFAGVVDVIACGDALQDNARKIAAEFNIPMAGSPEQVLANPAVELVLNLTPARAHHAVSLAILRAGKHLFSEKPLALTREDGREILALAAERGLRVGGAADTFLGAGIQLARKLVDEGRIGTPIAATALMSANTFHNARYHDAYRGVLLDLGPYYLTALITILGPIARVSGAAEIRFRAKPYAPDSPDAGKSFPVDIPTTVGATLEFDDGTVCSLIASGDVYGYIPRVEIIGRTGSITLHDANRHSEKVIVRGVDKEEVIQPSTGFRELGRGLGVAEMALALRENRAPRASGDLMYHVLDAMLAVHDSSLAERHVRLESRVMRPEPFDLDSLPAGVTAPPVPAAR